MELRYVFFVFIWYWSGFESSILGWIPIWIRIQGFDDPKIKKIYNWKKNLGIKNYNLPIPSSPYRTPKPRKKPSAFKREHPALQKFFFCGTFQIRIRILIHWPDWNLDPIRIRNTAFGPLVICKLTNTAGGRDAAGELHVSPVRGQDEAGQGGLRIRIHFIRIRIQHFRLNTDPDPGL